MSFTVVSQVARQLGVKPRDISDLFYARVFDDAQCPIVAGRRMIPLSYVPAIEAVLRERGIVQAEASTP